MARSPAENAGSGNHDPPPITRTFSTKSAHSGRCNSVTLLPLSGRSDSHLTVVHQPLEGRETGAIDNRRASGSASSLQITLENSRMRKIAAIGAAILLALCSTLTVHA